MISMTYSENRCTSVIISDHVGHLIARATPRTLAMKKMAKRRRRRVLGDAGIAIPQTVERPLTPRELANWLKVSPATIRRRLGELPHFRIGNRVRFMPSEVLAHYKRKPPTSGE